MDATNLLATEDEAIAVLVQSGADWRWPFWTVDITEPDEVAQAALRGAAALGVRDASAQPPEQLPARTALSQALDLLRAARIVVAVQPRKEGVAPLPLLLAAPVGANTVTVALLSPEAIVGIRTLEVGRVASIASAMAQAHADRSDSTTLGALIVVDTSDPTNPVRSADGQLLRADGEPTSEAKIRDLVAGALTAPALA